MCIRDSVQVFQGVGIRRHGGGLGETFTVRKVSFGVGVERTFPVHTPVSYTHLDVYKRQVLLGAVRVATSANVVVGTGDVLVQQVTP